jgi:hypothetical protein
MPEYLYPGVYVEEVDTGNKPIEGVSTSTVGFLGVAERGPITPTYVTSYTDFKRSFGTYLTDATGTPTAYLAYAVEGFFLNGGLRCWIARVASATATPASATSGPIAMTAAGPGAYGKNIAYWLRPASSTPNDKTNTTFRLTLYYWSAAADATSAVKGFDPAKPMTPPPSQTEDFDNLSTNQNSSMYFVGAVNSGSNLVTVTAVAGGGNPTTASTKPVLLSTGGSDGGTLAEADFKGIDFDPANPTTTPTGLAALSSVDEISLLCCPDEHNSGAGDIAGFMYASCLNLKDRFAILQSAPNAGKPQSVVPPQTAISKEGYAAFYYPWLNVLNPQNNVPVLIPPGGHIAGIYARSDNEENVAKDPANEAILGIDSLQLPINNQLQAQLNPIGVNCLRYFKGQGNLVWGGRTTSSDPDWQYINVRRLFIFVEQSIQRGTQWVVFQNNDPTTWARVVRSVSDFLTGLWMQDMLMGATKEQAFFVRCDRTTMTQTDIESGRLIVLIGIAPVYPAEFVIFRIGQWAGGSSVSEG